MKRWTGGSAIFALAVLLALRYFLLPSFPLNPSTSPPPSPPPPPLPPPHPKPRLLPSLPGLDLLFRPPPAAASQQTWRHLGPPLARSDALPNTPAAVLEASLAYKVLRELHPPSENSSSSEKPCPFSLTTNETSLEIPCGLTENSAVTLVGVPAGEFLVELVGSQLSKTANGPPVVLRVNVSFGRGGEGPAVVQNSWAPEFGWGQSQPCPDNTNGNLKVDGLVRCNEQSGESVIQEKVNGSVKQLEPPKKSSGMSIGFPFVEGQPFTATLWAGLEGFHLTVNGRHETSFAYRETLDPWSVTRIRVDGNLDLLSFLANGLPVLEDLDLVDDVEKLKAPLLPKKRIFMLVGVFSTVNNFERRMALRRSWMQYEAVRSGDVAVRFFTGLHKDKRVNLKLWQEAQIFGDIQLMPFVDYYSLITLKTIAICIFGTKILPAKYMMKTDDDAFVRIDEVLTSLKSKDSHGLLYGLISFESSPHREKDSKWYISPEEWPHESYPPWAHGPGYIISRDIAKYIVHGHQERDLPLFKLEDVAMGIWIQEFKNRGQQVNYVNDERFHSAGCESNYVLAHYQGPRLLLCLWDKLQRDHEPICCE